MREHNMGYYHFAKRMSQQHQQYFLDLEYDAVQFEIYGKTVKQSLQKQRAMEDSNGESFDDFLKRYFSQAL